MAQSTPKDTIAPYLPWATFKGYLQQLKSTAIPTRIDGTMMKGMSGSGQSALKTALRFFALIGDQGVVTQRLRDLVGALGTEAWAETLEPIVFESYQAVVQGVDLDNGTLGELQGVFRERAGVSGSVLKKAIRFWLAAMRDVGTTVSPHFGPSGVASNDDKPKRASGARRRPRTPGGGAGQDTQNPPPRPPNTQEVRFPIRGKPDVQMWLPQDLDPREWAMVDGYMRLYLDQSE